MSFIFVTFILSILAMDLVRVFPVVVSFEMVFFLLGFYSCIYLFSNLLLCLFLLISASILCLSFCLAPLMFRGSSWAFSLLCAPIQWVHLFSLCHSWVKWAS